MAKPVRTPMSRLDSRRHIRAQLRHATFVDPQTGVRSKRSFTLHDSDHAANVSIPPTSNGAASLPPRPDVEASASRSSRAQEVKTTITTKFRSCREFVTSDLGKNMFKFALAYLLGSMCTYIPIFNQILGKTDSKHTVATVTVYFHPGRSVGSMLEALILAFAAFIYAAGVSVSSMSVSVLFADVLHHIVIGHAIVLVVFIGGGLGMVGWIKLKKGSPLVNVACSLTSLALISILTSEGAAQAGDLSFKTISQYLKMILAGVIAASVVNFLVFPVSAQRQFKENMVEATDCMSDLLGLITSSFISGDEKELESKEFSGAHDNLRKTVTKLKQNLRESKFELNFVGHEEESKIQTKMVQCGQRIAQSIGGLRSAAAMQFVVIKQPLPMTSASNTGPFDSYASIMTSPSQTPNLERSIGPSFDFSTVLDAETDADGNEDGISRTFRRRPSKFRSPEQIFELFIDHLGPSMKSLAYTLKEILDELPFDIEDNFTVMNNPKFRISLERALSLYKEARKVALESVYNKKNMNRSRPIEVEADWEEAAACCGHFSFCLVEVAENVKEYLVILDDLEAEVEFRPTGRSWSWLKFWARSPREFDETDSSDGAHLVKPAESHVTDEYRIENPKTKPKGYDQASNSDDAPWKIKQRIFRKMYDATSFLRRDDKKYAIKVGLGAMLYALPSYIAVTRPFYMHWRGEWGLLSYMLVCSMTIGAANTTGYQRFMGTCLGAVLAVLAWEISNQRIIPFAFFGFCMAYWISYIIIGKGKGPMGRFILMTYNLSALYAYNLLVLYDDNDGDEEDGSQNPLILTIALHRCVAVLSGCVWGLVITRFVWPISARQKLKDGLCLLWLRMGLIWKRDPLSIFIDGESQNTYTELREEAELQRFFTKMQALVAASKNELELRRPFPDIAYNRILKSTSRMLEAFHTMQTVITKESDASKGEISLLKATGQERALLCTRISHQFSILASSIKLEYSIATDALPSTELTRDRLLATIFAYRKSDAFERKTSDEDYSLLYTYALVTGQIGMEIQSCIKEIESLFGILDEEALFLQ